MLQNIALNLSFDQRDSYWAVDWFHWPPVTGLRSRDVKCWRCLRRVALCGRIQATWLSKPLVRKLTCEPESVSRLLVGEDVNDKIILTNVALELQRPLEVHTKHCR